MAKYAHVHKGIVYLINGVQKDNKATDDILLSDDNIPYLRITLTKSDDNNINNAGNFIVRLDDLIEVGDEYSEGKFKINNDKFTEESGRKIDSYFEYQQYLNEEKAIEEINKGSEGWTCENAKSKFPFWFWGESGEVELDVIKTEYVLPNSPGKYNYSVEIINDTTEEYHDFDTDDALLESATSSANNILKNCNYKLTKILSKTDISEL